MKKQMVLKITTFAALLVFLLSMGTVNFAQMIQPDGINWTYLITCNHSFYATNTNPSNYTIHYSGSTSVGSNKNAYVIATVQRLGYDGVWRTYASVWDEGYAICGAQDDIVLAPGYTYQLKITHKAKTTDGTTLETFTTYSDNTITVPSI